MHRVLAILLPTAFFAALDRGALGVSADGTSIVTGALLTDSVRDQLLRMSRGVAVMLLIV